MMAFCFWRQHSPSRVRAEGRESFYFLLPPVRTWQTVPFVWAPHSLPFLPGVHHGSPSSKQEVQSSSSSICVGGGNPGGVRLGQLPLPGWTWALATFVSWPHYHFLCHVIHLSKKTICHLLAVLSQVREAAAHGVLNKCFPG